MRSLAFGVWFGILGYVIVAFVSYFLVGWFSSNTHDRSVEAAMTSVFFYGPLGGVIGFIAGVIRGGPSATKA